MKYSKILVILSILFLSTFKSNAQETSKPFEEFVDEYNNLLHNNKGQEVLNLLTKIRSKKFDKFSCYEKGYFYSRFAKLAFQYEDDKSAVKYWRDSCLVIWKNCLTINKEQLASTHYSIANSLTYLNRTKEAGVAYNTFVNLYDKLENYDPDKYCSKLLSIAEFYFIQNDIYHANLYFDRAESLLSKIDNEITKANFYRRKCLSHFINENYLQAIENGYNSNTLYIKQERKHYKFIITNQLNIASSYYYLKEFEKASEILKKVKSFYTKYNSKENIENYENLKTSILKELKEYPLAIKMYKKQIDKINSKKQKDQLVLASIYENIGDIFNLTSKYDSAHFYYDLSISNYLINSESIEEALKNPNSIINTPINLIGCLEQKANAFKSEFLATQDFKKLEKTLELYKSIDEIFDKSRKDYNQEQNKLYWIKKAKQVLNQAVDNSIELYYKTNDSKHLESAYRYASKSKAILLKEGSFFLDAMHSLLPDSIIKKENILVSNINKEIRKIKETNNHNRLDSLYAIYQNKKSIYEKFISSLEEEFPEYHKAKFTSIQPFTLKEVQIELNEVQQVLDYYVGKDSIYCFSIDKNNLKIKSQIKEKEFTTNLNELRIQLESSDQVSENLNDYFFQKLIGELINKGTKEILILPDEEINSIPFEAIKQGGEYLIVKYAISYMYSNNQVQNRTQNSNAKNYLGLGTNYSDNLKNNINENFINQNINLNSLNFATKEIELSSKYWNGEVHLNSAASKAKFIEKANNFNIIHFALHGIINNENPEYSSIVFDDRSNNNILRAEELYKIRLKNQLAILTSCNSGNGKLFKGEGVKSLARGFAFAGCPSVVSSLWSAYDKPTTEIITQFNKHLSEGDNKSVALQKAKIHYLNNAYETRISAKNWANLILIGDVQPISIKSNILKYSWLIIFPFLLFAFWFSMRKLAVKRA